MVRWPAATRPRCGAGAKEAKEAKEAARRTMRGASGPRGDKSDGDGVSPAKVRLAYVATRRCRRDPRWSRIDCNPEALGHLPTARTFLHSARIAAILAAAEGQGRAAPPEAFVPGFHQEPLSGTASALLPAITSIWSARACNAVRTAGR